jgi:adenylate kinase family enzyme
MERVVVIGNSGGGKSVLARKLASMHNLPYREVDTLLLKP